MNDITNVAKLQETTDIANRAMKFRLSRGGTKRRVRDKDAEALVKQTLGDEGQIVSRELFKGKNAVSDYQALANEMHGYHVKSTLPFGDDSSRVLLNAQYFTYTTEMNNYISQLAQKRSYILANWDNLVIADIQTRNAALVAAGNKPIASVTDYPTRANMDNRLYVTWFPEPIASTGDFRFQLPPEMLDVVDRQFKDMVEVASRERFTRMLTPISAFIGKLEKYTGEKGQRWYDSFVENLAALPDEISALNIKDEPEVDRFLKEIGELVAPHAANQETLKEDQSARDEMKKKLEALEQGLKGYAW
jgi:hypothetical protein